ncbi:MAG: TraR/DksA C4-type zinc finger protein [Actinomycetota bacterium]
MVGTDFAALLAERLAGADARIAAAESQRTAIQLAFARLEAGTYGDCVNCGGPIEESRLLARPEAELCIDCVS